MKKILLAIIFFLSSGITKEIKCDFSSKISKEAVLLLTGGAYILHRCLNPQKSFFNDEVKELANDPELIKSFKFFGSIFIYVGIISQIHKINPSLLPNRIKAYGLVLLTLVL